MVGEFHALDCPPHWKAKSMQITADIMNREPSGSIFSSF